VATLRERKKDRTRQEILAAATRLFATQGYAKTTITEIAEAAEVGRRTFFSYFPTKENLVFGALEQRLDRFEIAVAELRQPVSLTGLLETWLEIDMSGRENADLRERHRQSLELVLGDPDLQLQEHRYLRRAAKIIAGAIAPTLGERVDGFRTELVAMSVVAVLSRLGLQRLVSSGGLQDEDVETAVRYLEAGMDALVTGGGSGAQRRPPAASAGVGHSLNASKSPS
jgi:AcrR family transcriptional regulator